ncbi:MAG: hypothetical protein H7641_02100 [Candidatus Heimdallarchaeota archaeon]|nr:hypothetical protein [Candidatus Heimdallarchaeota archaeon]MCK4876356.1 hypothetical protein [Candidatus Heimdallarchaeota archaeon]
MDRRNALNTMFINIRKDLFELVNMIEIKIDIGYILEEIEELSYEVQKMSEIGSNMGVEMKDIYNSLYNKYKNKLASFLTPREANHLVSKIMSWIQTLPGLI